MKNGVDCEYIIEHKIFNVTNFLTMSKSCKNNSFLIHSLNTALKHVCIVMARNRNTALVYSMAALKISTTLFLVPPRTFRSRIYLSKLIFTNNQCANMRRPAYSNKFRIGTIVVLG